MNLGARLSRSLILLALASAAYAREKCEPPSFYTSLPRDRDYYYGVARDPDTDKARDQAIRNLGKQVTGELENWPQDKIDAVAGPCRDKWEVAASVGKLLPRSSLLAGWEQDDFERCGGYSYVLVRVQKERVERFVSGSAPFKRDVAARLSRRLDGLRGGGKSVPEERAIARTVSQARLDLGAGKPRVEIERTLAAAEEAYSKLEKRMVGYERERDGAEGARLARLKAEKAPELKRNLAAVESGRWGYAEAAAVIGAYNEQQEYEALRSFTRSLLARKDLANLGEHRDFVAYMGIVADLSLKDEESTLADGEAFLKEYPASDLFEAVKAQIAGTIAMARTPKAPASAARPDAGPAPCPAL